MNMQRIQVPEDNSPVVSDALVSLFNDAKSAMDANDFGRLVLLREQIRLQFIKHRDDMKLKKSQQALKNFEALSDYEKEQYTRSQDAEIQAAIDAGDYAKAHRLQRVKEGQLAPQSIQEFDRFTEQYGEPSRAEAAEFFGLALPEPRSQRAPTKLEEIEQLYKDKKISEELYNRAIEHHIAPTKDKDLTGKRLDIAIIKELVADGTYTEEQGQEAIEALFLPSVKNTPTTDTETARQIMLSLPKGGPTASVLNKANIQLSNPAANKMISYIGNLTRKPDGTHYSFNELKDAPAGTKLKNIFNRILGEFKSFADFKGGSEATLRVQLARERLNQGVPHLIELMEDYERKHGSGALGRDFQVVNGVLKFVKGTPSNVDAEEIISYGNNMISEVLVFRSGATVTDVERKITEAIAPTGTIPLAFSRARAKALLDANRQGALEHYTKSLNPEYAAEIVDRHYTQKMEAVKPLPLPAGITEDYIKSVQQQYKERTGTTPTRNDVIKRINQRKNDAD